MVKKYRYTSPEIPKYPPIPPVSPGEIWKYCRSPDCGVRLVETPFWRGMEPPVTGLLQGGDEFLVLETCLSRINTLFIRILVSGTGIIGWLCVEANVFKYLDLVWA